MIDTPGQRRALALFENEWTGLRLALSQLEPKVRRDLSALFILLLLLDLSEDDRSGLMDMLRTGKFSFNDQQTPVAH